MEVYIVSFDIIDKYICMYKQFKYFS